MHVLGDSRVTNITYTSEAFLGNGQCDPRVDPISTDSHGDVNRRRLKHK